MVDGASKWCKRAKKALIERNMSQSELAAKIGVKRAYVSQVLNGVSQSRPMIEKISEYLGISSDY